MSDFKMRCGMKWIYDAFIVQGRWSEERHVMIKRGIKAISLVSSCDASCPGLGVWWQACVDPRV